MTLPMESISPGSGQTTIPLTTTDSWRPSKQAQVSTAASSTRPVAFQLAKKTMTTTKTTWISTTTTTRERVVICQPFELLPIQNDVSSPRSPDSPAVRPLRYWEVRGESAFFAIPIALTIIALGLSRGAQKKYPTSHGSRHGEVGWTSFGGPFPLWGRLTASGRVPVSWPASDSWIRNGVEHQC
jgi:hypothetical protein